MRGPQPDRIRLSQQEREDLERLIRRHTTSQQLALRGRMIMAAAEGANNSQIARQLGVDYETVGRWRQRWIGLQAAALEDLPGEDRLTDAPRPGRPAETHSGTNLPDCGLRL